MARDMNALYEQAGQQYEAAEKRIEWGVARKAAAKTPVGRFIGDIAIWSGRAQAADAQILDEISGSHINLSVELKAMEIANDTHQQSLGEGEL